MLAKRLAGIIMCIEGKTSYRIWKDLNISSATAERLYDKYEHGDYDEIEKLLTKNQASFDKICRTLEFILRGGLPPRVGRDRAKYMFKMLPPTKSIRRK